MSSAETDVSVVVCAYTEERWDDIEHAVASLQLQTSAPREVILVIDHNDRLLTRALASLPWTRVIANTGARGLSDARNTGVRAAVGGIVAFLDDDAAAEPNWLELLVAGYADPAVIGVGGSAIPQWAGGERPRWFPEEFDWVVGCSYRGMPVHRMPVRNFLGCNMSFRREAFERAGSFDPSVGRVGTRPVGCEETEFCIRLSRIVPGRLLVYEPAARVVHRVPAVRATLRYFWARCAAEGASKAIVSELAGSDQALSSERSYALVTLPKGVLRNAATIVSGFDPAGFLRAGAIMGGLAITTVSYVWHRLVSRLRGTGPTTDSVAR